VARVRIVDGRAERIAHRQTAQPLADELGRNIERAMRRQIAKVNGKWRELGHGESDAL
jgi:hypothetical protein